jgi:hypothetical protein
MPNVNKVNGFRPVSTLTGAAWNGQITRYVAVTGDSTIIAVGDLVKLDGGTGVGEYAGIRGVTRAAASDAVVGVVVGFDVNPANLDTPQVRAASTARYVYVVDDPNAFFVAQEDGDTTPIAMASVGLNVNFIVAAASTITGASGMQIDSSTASTTATLPLKLIAPLAVSDNELTTSGQSYTRWVVKINNHQLGASTGTAGV